MKRNSQKKENQEIEPLPKTPPVKPSTPITIPTTPEIIPLPEKNDPIRPSLPEIQPNQQPEIKQDKKHHSKK